MNPFGCAKRTGDLNVPLGVPSTPKPTRVVGDEDSGSAATIPSPSIAVALQLSPFPGCTSKAIAVPGGGGRSPVQSAVGPPSGVITGLGPPSPAASTDARPPHASAATQNQRRQPAQRMPVPQRRERRASGTPPARPPPSARWPRVHLSADRRTPQGPAPPAAAPAPRIPAPPPTAARRRRRR